MECVAPNCSFARFDNNMHCRQCSKKFGPIYKKYKSAQHPIDKFIEDPSKLITLANEELLKVLSAYNRVADLRRKYQLVAMRPQFHDHGHEKFIRKLKLMSCQIICMLSARFVLACAKDNASESNEPNESHPDDKITSKVEPMPTQQKEINLFLENSKQLDEELVALMSKKAQLVEKIRSEIMIIYEKVAPFLTLPLDLNDRAAVLLCYPDLTQLAVTDAHHAVFEEEAMLGGMIECGMEKFDRLVEVIPCSACAELDKNPSDERIICPHKKRTYKLNHIQPRKYYVINWQQMPANLDEVIEFIYQGRIPAPKYIDEENCMAIALLIDESKRQSDSFVYHFDINIFGKEENTQMLHIHAASELPGFSKTYYPKQFKKKQRR